MTLIPLTPGKALGVSCILGTLETSWRQADIVAVITVGETHNDFQPDEENYISAATIHDIYKGELTEGEKIHGSGFFFDTPSEDTLTLLFANYDEQNRAILVDCSGTIEWHEAAKTYGEPNVTKLTGALNTLALQEQPRVELEEKTQRVSDLEEENQTLKLFAGLTGFAAIAAVLIIAKSKTRINKD